MFEMCSALFSGNTLSVIFRDLLSKLFSGKVGNVKNQISHLTTLEKKRNNKELDKACQIQYISILVYHQLNDYIPTQILQVNVGHIFSNKTPNTVVERQTCLRAVILLKKIVGSFFVTNGDDSSRTLERSTYTINRKLF